MTQTQQFQTGAEVRLAARQGELTGQTSGLAAGFVQANLAILPQDLAEEFQQFCRLNSQACPLLDVTQPGSAVPKTIAPTADLRTDLPRYRVWRDGELVDEPTNITDYWRDDLVSFLIGCSFTFEAALFTAGIPIRHIEQGSNVPMYRTNIDCVPSGSFHGPLVVSMRPLKPADAIAAVQITSKYPTVHGAPIHLGLPDKIGITDISQPDYGEAVEVRDDELPVFWACGVTPQSVIMAAKPPLAITHSPGCMFLTDLRDVDLATD